MKNWPLWEIFIRSKQGINHKHVGSLHAADAEMAIQNARDVYTRRNEGVSIWVVLNRTRARCMTTASLLHVLSAQKTRLCLLWVSRGTKCATPCG